jgi:glycosyltransferase involved in cell wall biosynthesis
VTLPTSSPGAAWLQIIVPARNEQDRLPAGLAQLCAKAASMPGVIEILVVDSASTDLTAQIVREWPAGPVPVRLVSIGRPGKGAAVRAGLLASSAPFVGFCDADVAADLSALDAATEHLLAGRQVVIGSRAHPASVVEARHSTVRKAGAAVFRGVAQLVAQGPGDTQCGFKFFAGPLARRAAADLTAIGFAFDVELIARCRQLGADVVEIPVSWRDIPGSTFSIWRHSVTVFAEIARIWLSLRLQSSFPSGADVPALPAPAGAAPALASTALASTAVASTAVAGAAMPAALGAASLGALGRP